MEFYLVGGAVRDKIMGVPVSDRDYVVVGSTTEQMLAQGFKQVGKDFPVFLDPGGVEYALARTERSTGASYTDFVCDTENVTLEQDLMRRDLTINAIAIDESGQVVDPFCGRGDIWDRILRHVDDLGFVEDPLRVLRLARFCAKFPTFQVHPSTVALCRKMVADGMLQHLTPERVSTEMLKAFGCEQPTRFFYFLQMVGALEVVFPELYNLVGVPAGPYLHHPEGDCFMHTMQVVDQVVSHKSDCDRSLLVFCALTHDLGKANSDPGKLPHHYGHEFRGTVLVKAMVERLRLATKFENYGVLVAKYHTHVHNFAKLNPKTIVDMAEQLKHKANPEIFDLLTTVSAADARGRSSFYQQLVYPQQFAMFKALNAAVSVEARHVCTEQELKNVNVLKSKLRHARIQAVDDIRYQL